MKPMTKGEKNETEALWVLSEPVRRLMYGRADAAGEEPGVGVGGVRVKGRGGGYRLG